MVDWLPSGHSKSLRLYTIYELVWALVLVNAFLLRHASEKPEVYTPYYRQFWQWTFNGLYVLSVVSFVQAAKKRPPAALSSHGQIIYCADCEVDVQTDSHHCIVCEQCTLRMRTHCTWFHNCIGQENYKPLFLFLLYATLAGCIFAYLLFDYVWGRKAPDYLQGVTFKLFIYFHCLGVLMMWTNCVHLLFLHVLLLINGLALVDLTKGVKIARVPCIKDYIPVNDYDLGTMANLRNYLGNDVMWWWLPTRPYLGSQETQEVRAPDVPKSLIVA